MAYQRAAMAEIRHEGARLDELKADPGWTDLNVNGCDTAWLNYPDGRKVLVDPPLWRSDDEMRAWVQMRARLAGGGTEHRFDADAWMLTIDQDDGSRLSAVWGGRGQRGVASRPGLCIRRHQGALQAFTLDDLLALGSLSPAALEFLPTAVEARLNIVIAAMTGAGKTTLLRALALQTPRRAPHHLERPAVGRRGQRPPLAARRPHHGVEAGPVTAHQAGGELVGATDGNDPLVAHHLPGLGQQVGERPPSGLAEAVTADVEGPCT